MLFRAAVIKKRMEHRVHRAAAEVAVNAYGLNALIEADVRRAVAWCFIVGRGQRFCGFQLVFRAVKIEAVIPLILS